MALKLGYRDGGKTSEEGLNRITSQLISSAGVFGVDDLKVVATGTPDNKVNVSIGDVAIGNNSPNTNDPDYYYHGWNTSSVPLTISANASGNPRIDVVVAYVDLSVVSSTSNDNPGALAVKIVAGTAAATPSAADDAAIQASVGASNPWVLLAQVAVANGFSTISNSDITDLRGRVSTVARMADDFGSDFVGSGLVWSQASGLIGQVTTGYAYINGELVNKSYLKHTFATSKDTYVDLPLGSKPTSVDDFTYTAVANGAAAPSLAANSIRLAKVVTSGAAITSVVTSGVDSLGNSIRGTTSLGQLSSLVSYGSLTSDGADVIRSNNMLINGGMDVWQRGTTFTTPNDDTYIADRWNFLTEANGAWTITRDTDVPNGFNFSAKFTNVTLNNQCGIVQIIEGKDCKRLANGDLSVSLSFWAKTNGTEIANLRAAILSWSSTEDVVTSDVVSAWGQNGTDPTWAANWVAENTPSNLALTSGWQKFTVENVIMDSATINNVAVVIWVDDGTVTANDDFYITGVQLNVGSKAASYQYEPYGDTLARCERFYQIIRDTNQDYTAFAPAFVAGGQFQVATPVSLRGNPTITWANMGMRFGGADYGFSALALLVVVPAGVSFVPTYGGSPANGNAGVVWTNLGGKLYLDAEL